MTTIADVVRRYLAVGCAEKSPRTVKADASCATQVLRALGNYHLDAARAATARTRSLTGSVVVQYRADRKREGISPATIKRELAVASAACRWCISEENWDISNPFAGRLISKLDARSLTSEARQLTQDECARLILAAEQPMADIIAFAVLTALRRDEIRLLTWDRVDGRLIRFGASNQKSRRVGVRAMPAEARVILDRQVKRGPMAFPILSVARFDYLFGKARERSGVQCKFHELRHTWACRAREAGVSMEDIQAQMGHTDIRVTEKVYARPGHESVLRAVAFKGEWK